MDFNVQQEIIQWEEQCWILFQQKMGFFRQKVEEEFDDKDAQEMVEDYLDDIKRGDYVIP